MKKITNYVVALIKSIWSKFINLFKKKNMSKKILNFDFFKDLSELGTKNLKLKLKNNLTEYPIVEFDFQTHIFLVDIGNNSLKKINLSDVEQISVV